jgi:hypothetical protein
VLAKGVGERVLRRLAASERLFVLRQRFVALPDCLEASPRLSYTFALSGWLRTFARK